MCEPPRLPEDRAACRGSPGASGLTSSSSRCRRRGRDRYRPARGPRRTAGCRARRCGDWSMITAFTGARLRASDGAQLRAGSSVEGVGAETILVGIELDRAEPARVAHEHRATVGERHPEAVPRGIGLVAGVATAGRRRPRRRPARGRSCRGAGRALRHWSHVDEDQTSRDGGRRRTTGRAARRGPAGREAALEEPRVGRVHRSDLPVEGTRLDQRPRRLDLEDLGQVSR